MAAIKINICDEVNSALKIQNSVMNKPDGGIAVIAISIRRKTMAPDLFLLK